ncbi:hypothetical protein GL2_26180 [Microbulbifer sp. GL-2]|nr:hypothetical protein GL2_26180 [Microbulbifer sp. GL-2]
MDLVDAQSMAPSLLEVKAKLRLLCSSAEQEVFHALAPGSQVFEGRTDNLEAQFVQTDAHSVVFFSVAVLNI